MACFKDVARKSLQRRNLQNLTTRIVSSFFLPYDCKDPGLSFWGEWQIIHSLILSVLCFNRYLFFCLFVIVFFTEVTKVIKS